MRRRDVPSSTQHFLAGTLTEEEIGVGLKRKTQWLRANVIPKITNMEITSTKTSFPFSSSPLRDIWGTPTKSAVGAAYVTSSR